MLKRLFLLAITYANQAEAQEKPYETRSLLRMKLVSVIARDDIMTLIRFIFGPTTHYSTF